MFLATSVGLSAGCGNSSVGSGAETGGGSASAGGVKKFLDDVNADLLKISRFALQRKLEKYGIELPDSE